MYSATTAIVEAVLRYAPAAEGTASRAKDCVPPLEGCEEPCALGKSCGMSSVLVHLRGCPGATRVRELARAGGTEGMAVRRSNFRPCGELSMWATSTPACCRSSPVGDREVVGDDEQQVPLLSDGEWTERRMSAKRG